MAFAFELAFFAVEVPGKDIEILSGSESFRGEFPIFVESRKTLSTSEWKEESGDWRVDWAKFRKNDQIKKRRDKKLDIDP